MSKENKIDLKNKYLEIGNVLDTIFESGVSSFDAEHFSEDLYEALKADDHDSLMYLGLRLCDYARAKEVLKEFKVNEKILLEENRVEKTNGEKDIVILTKYKKRAH
jgi:hypothetical protein